jgi:hypothetical protein
MFFRHEYRHEPRAEWYALEAATALDIEPERAQRPRSTGAARCHDRTARERPRALRRVPANLVRANDVEADSVCELSCEAGTSAHVYQRVTTEVGHEACDMSDRRSRRRVDEVNWQVSWDVAQNLVAVRRAAKTD